MRAFHVAHADRCTLAGPVASNIGRERRLHHRYEQRLNGKQEGGCPEEACFEAESDPLLQLPAGAFDACQPSCQTRPRLTSTFESLRPPQTSLNVNDFSSG